MCWVPQDSKPVYICLECEKEIEWERVGTDNKKRGLYKAQPHSHGNNASIWDRVF